MVECIGTIFVIKVCKNHFFKKTKCKFLAIFSAYIMNNIVNLKDINNLCRICLTKSTSAMMHLESPFKETLNSPSVLQVLEEVMSVKLIINEKYPSTICAMCKGLLKISHDLNVTFNNSQKALMEHFNETSYEKKTEIKIDKFNKAPVELIFGNNKYDLNDVVIVEEEENNSHNFQGFLNNLGTTVSAVFVKTSTQKNKCKFKEMLDNHITITNRNFISDTCIENASNNNESGENTELKNENHIDQKILKNIYKCNSCKILCASRTRLKIHLRKYHLHEIPYVCEVCGSTLFKNTITDNDEILDTISCDECGSIDSKKRILSKNNFRKAPNKEYLCQICGYISKNSSSASYHQRKHSEARFMCHICDKKYQSKASLENHLNGHQNIRNHLCTACGKRFNYYSALVYHMRIHTNERNYICNFCDRKFYMPTALKRHIRTHTGIRPYDCRCCGKAFFSLGERQKHEMIHTGQRPYKCKYCNKGFTSSFNRKIHYMSHSGPHTCDYCTKTFIEMEFLKKHVNSKHKHD